MSADISNAGSSNSSTLNRYIIEQNNSNYEAKYKRILSAHHTKIFGFQDQFNYTTFVYRRIASVQFTHSDKLLAIVQGQLEKIFLALWSVKAKFHIFIRNNGEEIYYYIGTNSAEMIDTVCHIYEGAVQGVMFAEDGKCYSFNDIIDKDSRQVGLFSGNPVVNAPDSVGSGGSAMDELIMGTKKIHWSLSLYAEPVNMQDIIQEYDEWLNECTESSEHVSANFSYGSGAVEETMHTTKVYSGAKSYNTFSEDMCSVLKEALQCGKWRVTPVCFSRTESDLELFGGMFSSQMMSGCDTIERPLSFLFLPQGKLKKHPGYYIAGSVGTVSYLTGKEMATLASMPVNDTQGFQVSDCIDFDVSAQKRGNFPIGWIIDGTHQTECPYQININSLNRHALIIGLTGGGKTNTVKSLVYSLHAASLPFLIIESAKKEYYELYRMGLHSLQVYSVGSNTRNTFKINPFECMEGIPLQSHIDAVFSAFKASFIMYTPMPYVLENAIYEIYQDYGWNIETGINRYHKRIFPTIEDLYYKIAPVVIQMGYDAKMQNDLIGSLKARINSLRMGAKGNTLNVAQSIPMPELLKGEVVIELDDIGDEEAKSFIISIILMQLNECRKSDVIRSHITNQTADLQQEVQHIVIIEEAHRLLKNVKSGSGENADPRGAAVEYFCNMLAEIRSRGQGFMIVDQIPSKLAPDLIKNTNLKIIHRTVDKEDRMLVGGAAHMTEAQVEYLSCLTQGVAAVYSEGDNRPKLVKIPYAKQYEITAGLSRLGRNEILQYTNENCIILTQEYKYGNQAACNRICALCPFALECIHTGDYMLDRLRGLLDAASVERAINSVNNTRLDSDLYTWIKEEYLPNIHQGCRYTVRCLSAMWLRRCESKMKYKDKSAYIERFLSTFDTIL